ncbi:tetratricopeptide repeat protein [Confluentibacter lentus]|uniref:tetratricopeptide repeat protein n=1 Tax=Confluentibacter lentus TaxID=1699412 RepID=UPI000C28E9DD|nr:tetratricopeptide repeat protein [Confluentibacter lentus]
MKKQIIIALAVSISAFSFAQKKELKAVEKAIKGNNYAEAKSALKQAESLMSAMDAKTKAEYYYLNAQALYAGGAGSMTDIDAAIESLGNVEGAYVAESNELKQTMVNSILTKGNDLYEKQDFSTSSKYFEKAYRLSEKDTTFLYYAAVTAVNVQEYDRALKLYEELKKIGYTGIEKQFYATNKETGEEDILDKAARDLYVRSGTHINPGERMTESKKPEIVKNVALIYVTNGDNEKAIAAIKDAKAESPDDINLILTEANIYFKMGNNEEFKKLLETATEKDPNNAELQYNLGVLSAESGDVENAKKYYAKSIQLNPNYVNAYINMAAVVLEKEKSIIEEMNNLGTSSADNKKYDELVEVRKVVYKEAVPYLEQAMKLDSNNVSAVSTLMNIYSILGETAKQKEMKDKLDSINTEN